VIPIRTADELKHLDLRAIESLAGNDWTLMERAVQEFCLALNRDYSFDSVKIFCGPGNNGGDGLGIARQLSIEGKAVRCFISESSHPSGAYLKNLKMLPSEVEIISLDDRANTDLIIDALFGYGLNRALENGFSKVVKRINEANCKIVSVDIPSGMPAEPLFTLDPGNCVTADKVYTFHSPKLSFFSPDSALFCQSFEILDIGLPESDSSDLLWMESKDFSDIYEPGNPAWHKYQRGSVFLAGGSKGKGGSIIMSAEAALRSGAGLVHVHTASVLVDVLLGRLPEAMYSSGGEEYLSDYHLPDRVDAVGIGPGLGFNQETKALFREYLKSEKSLILDADALRMLSDDNLLGQLPQGSILTPHEGEFQNLVGTWTSFDDKILKLKTLASRYQGIVVLKGAYSIISDGNRCYFNPSGIPELATAGSGDVLLGIISSLRAQGYSALDSALLGTFIHGIAAQAYLKSVQSGSLIATDICKGIGSAIVMLKTSI
jgi:hydroxyethylthiazole kinase-like uncharacterized protein yjeF